MAKSGKPDLPFLPFGAIPSISFEEAQQMIRDSSFQIGQLDRLDEIAVSVMNGELDSFGVLSTGETIYVALAANRADLLPSGYTLVACIDRLGESWRAELLKRWEFGPPQQLPPKMKP